MLAREHLAVQNVDLEVADAQARDQLAGAAVRAADHRMRAGDQIVRHEGDADVVVGAALERVKLAAQIAAPGERDDAHGSMGPPVVDEPDRPAGLGIDVDHEQIRLPLPDRGPGLVHRSGDAALIAPVTQGEIDGVRERLVRDNQQHADGAVGISGGA